MFLGFIGEFGMLSRRLKDGKGAKMNSGEDLLEALSHIIHPQISQVGSVGGRQGGYLMYGVPVYAARTCMTVLILSFHPCDLS